MTGPSPDDDLDNALGLNQLPPAAITADHRDRATTLLVQVTETPFPVNPAPSTRRALDAVAQALADAEQRGAARIIAEHEAAGGSA